MKRLCFVVLLSACGGDLDGEWFSRECALPDSACGVGQDPTQDDIDTCAQVRAMEFVHTEECERDYRAYVQCREKYDGRVGVCSETWATGLKDSGCDSTPTSHVSSGGCFGRE